MDTQAFFEVFEDGMLVPESSSSVLVVARSEAGMLGLAGLMLRIESLAAALTRSGLTSL